MRVFLFDIDGTLVSTGGAGKFALEDAFSAEFQVSKPHEVSLSGRTDRGIASELFERHGIPDTEENWRRFQHAYLDRLKQQLSRRQGAVLPGVSLLLERLAGHEEAALGLLTGNVPDGARLKLEHYRLFHHFAFGGFGERHGDRNKVAHDALAEARAYLARPISGDRVWVIGDTPLDVECARAINAQVVAVATGAYSTAELNPFEPDLLVEDLTDTEGLVKRMLAD